MEILFQYQGKKIDPEDIAEGSKQSVLKTIKDLIEDDIGGNRCPWHDIEPKLLFVGDYLNDLKLEIFSCCQDFTELLGTLLRAKTDYDCEIRKSIEIYGEEANKLKSRFVCRTCKHETFHFMQYAQTTKLNAYGMYDDHNVPYRFIWDVWLVWRCRQCLALTLEITSRTSDWFEGDSLEDFDFDAMGMSSFYPEIGKTDERTTVTTHSAQLIPKSFKHVPKKLVQTYAEVIQAYNQHHYILCTIGLRGLIEEICKHEKVNQEKELWKRIQNLSSIGIPIKVTENLQGVKELGNKAAHELKPARSEDIQVAIELLEEILNFVYELERKSRRLTRYRRKIPNSRTSRTRNSTNPRQE